MDHKAIDWKDRVAKVRARRGENMDGTVNQEMLKKAELVEAFMDGFYKQAEAKSQYIR